MKLYFIFIKRKYNFIFIVSLIITGAILIEYKFRGAGEDNDLWQADNALYRARLNEAKAKMELMREAYSEDLSQRAAFIKARNEYTALLHATRLSFSRTTPYFENDH